MLNFYFQTRRVQTRFNNLDLKAPAQNLQNSFMFRSKILKRPPPFPHTAAPLLLELLFMKKYMYIKILFLEK